MAAAAAKIRERFLKGETLNALEIAERYGVNGSNLALVVKKMKDEGYRFERIERRENKRVYADWRVTGVPKYLSENGSKVAPEQQTQTSTNGSTPPSDLPVLGQRLMVCALSMDEHGVVSVALRGEKRTWLCEVRGTA